MNKIIIFIALIFLSFYASAHQGRGFEITHLTGDFYVYTTWQMAGEILFPANGIYVVTSSGIVIIDSPWDTTQAVQLLDSIEKQHHKKVIAAIATHYHEDRTGAFDIFRRRDVATYSSCQTLALSREKGNRQAQFCFAADTVFDFGDHTLQTLYPGEGHTKDNIVIWFEQEKILYGGCLIKSVEAKDMGYTADANMKEWVRSLDKVARRFPHPAFIIPGHQGWTDKSALFHTRQLLQVYLSQKGRYDK